MYLTPEDYEIAEKNGINRINLESRFYRRNWNKERALTEPVRYKANLWGIHREQCREIGLSRQSFYKRIRLEGMNPEEAATTPKRSNNRLGKNNLSSIFTPEDYERAAANGISRDALANRVYSQGWDKERAITQPLNQKSQRTMIWEKLKDRAVVNRATYNKRVHNGMSPEKAALTPIERPNYTAEDVEKAESNGISYNTFKNRINTYKWPVEVATTAPLGTKWRKGRNNHGTY